VAACRPKGNETAEVVLPENRFSGVRICAKDGDGHFGIATAILVIKKIM
jgi:hypothetical protein